VTIHRSPPQFTISTQGAFNENGVWLIEARLRFGRRAARQVARVLLGETRVALMGALTREALRGRVLGANVIRVQLDAGGHVTEFGFDDRFHDLDFLH
jgi:hypothetical protein